MLTGAFLYLPFGVHARGRQPQAPAAILPTPIRKRYFLLPAPSIQANLSTSERRNALA